VRIAFVYGAGRLPRLPRVRRGEAPSEFFYGAIELARGDHEVGYFEPGEGAASGGLSGAALGWLQRRRLLPSRAEPGLLRAVGALLGSLDGFDVVVGTTPGLALSLALWRRLGRLRPPVVGILVGLLHYRPNWVKRQVNGHLLRRMWSQLYGEGELEQLRAWYGLPEARLVVNQFGVDTAFWRPGGGPGEGYVLSVGNDSRRDYELLMEVAERVDQPFVVVTSRAIARGIPSNVRLLRGTWHGEEIPDDELRRLYQQALCVVIPLAESRQPSGQSVCLQAMACGAPVVLTRTAGLWSPAMMRDGDNVLLVPGGDAAVLVEAVGRLAADAAVRARIGARGRETVCAEGSIAGFAERLGRLCAAAVAGT
jgi:glycosyltransferase involved in cell wall biosynthesis